MIVPESLRNVGYSLGLQYPYIYGKLCLDKLEEHGKATTTPSLNELDRMFNGTYCVWNRHTGGIVYTSENDNPVLADYDAKKKCHELNGLNPYVVDPEVILEMDMEG